MSLVMIALYVAIAARLASLLPKKRYFIASRRAGMPMLANGCRAPRATGFTR